MTKAELTSRILRSLEGSFTCIRCGSELHAASFGFGTAICPDCYMGEQPFLFLDESFILNRLMSKMIGAPNTSPKHYSNEPISEKYWTAETYMQNSIEKR